MQQSAMFAVVVPFPVGKTQYLLISICWLVFSSYGSRNKAHRAQGSVAVTPILSMAASEGKQGNKSLHHLVT